jgi:hypothetical protein
MAILQIELTAFMAVARRSGAAPPVLNKRHLIGGDWL